MGAPKGNQFWKQRSKHGRDSLFSSPELMWESACEYFQWCIDNPLQREEIVKYKDDYDRITVDVMRVFTYEGLGSYLDCSKEYFNKFDPKGNEDFIRVLTRIHDTIRRQKFEGAASGFFNSSLITRDLGLADKQDHTHEVTEIDFTK